MFPVSLCRVSGNRTPQSVRMLSSKATATTIIAVIKAIRARRMFVKRGYILSPEANESVRRLAQ
jgi:hypothetical protein